MLDLNAPRRLVVEVNISLRPQATGMEPEAGMHKILSFFGAGLYDVCRQTAVLMPPNPMLRLSARLIW